MGGGRMNQFDLIPGAALADGFLLPFTQAWPEDIPNYWRYAQTFGTQATAPSPWRPDPPFPICCTW